MDRTHADRSPAVSLSAISGDPCVVCLVGDVCADTAAYLRETFASSLDATPAARVVLDLSRLRQIDSSGLAILLLLDRDARSRGKSLALTGLPRMALRALEMTGVIKLLEVIS